ncbi:unnamed protein product [Litomosoides sigmodontis]|uniref:Uncharacterized protein n=1 Tax=Litomosoides sigmodontis TaxID=42156 RepID=A0A3P6TAV3_LITSI|nr:unnamed protein product [Litomosoides sigmodontis]
MAAVNQFHTLKSTENFGISINYDCNRSFDGTMVAAEEVSTVARRRRTGRQQRGEGTAFEFRPINVSDIGGTFCFL